MTNSWKIRGNSCSLTQWLRQFAAIRRIRRTHVKLHSDIRHKERIAWKATL